MILKLIQPCFIILSMNYIDSYVLFAANLDDFRSIAKRIIPGKLADQLADMASKSSMSYRQENQKNKDAKEKNQQEEYKDSDESYSNDSKYHSSKDYNSDDSTFSDSDAYYEPGQLGIENKEQALKKRYSIRNQIENIDLDELVRRVKDQLEKEYNINNTNRPTDTSKITTTTVKSNKVDDYYYRDDKLNIDFNKDDDQKYSGFHDKQYHDKNANAMWGSITDNAKTARELIEQNLNKSVKEYEKLAKDNNEPVMDIVDYNNVNKHNEGGNYEGEVINDIPEYYEDNEKESARYDKEAVKDVANNNEKEANEAPEYYQDNVKEPARISKKDVQELVKYNDNEKEVPKHYEDNITTEPTRYYQKMVREVASSNEKYEKDVPEFYEDNAKEPAKTILKENAKEPVKNVEDLVPYKKPNVKRFVIKEKNITKELAPAKSLVKYDEETINDGVEYYDENTKDIQHETTPETGDFFKEVNMDKPDDSYEDYVTPIRDDIFDSNEGTTQRNFQPIKPMGVKKFAANMKYKKSRQKAASDGVAKKVVNGVVSPPNKKRHTTPQIKAKTARLWYNDPNIENYDDSIKQAKALAASNTTKKPRINTMFPTRFHVKISSPNYFAKLPAVGEKYNFDEAIPEKDREPENIKHIMNPPALINKKVKI